MKFSARISRQPIPVDDDRARHIREIFDPGGALSDLVAGADGSSPHLADLIEKEAGWLAGALDDDDVVARETAGFEDLDSAALSVALRRAKRRVALFVALADLGGVWSLEQVTGALSDLADRAVDLALRVHVAQEAGRGKLPENNADCGGVSRWPWARAARAS